MTGTMVMKFKELGTYASRGVKNAEDRIITLKPDYLRMDYSYTNILPGHTEDLDPEEEWKRGIIPDMEEVYDNVAIVFRDNVAGFCIQRQDNGKYGVLVEEKFGGGIAWLVDTKEIALGVLSKLNAWYHSK